MKTIENYEFEIDAKASVIRQQLAIFYENISRIGSVIGKDSTKVYNVLLKSFDTVINTYKTSTNRNTEILQGYVDVLDRIATVLSVVMDRIDMIDNVPVENSLDIHYDINDTLEKAYEDAKTIESEVENKVQIVIANQTGVVPSDTMVHYLVIGGGSYLISRLLGLSRLASAGIAVGSCYLVK